VLLAQKQGNNESDTTACAAARAIMYYNENVSKSNVVVV
jgi:hypothetical protein